VRRLRSAAGTADTSSEGASVEGKRNPEENVTDNETNENPRKKTFSRDTTEEG
jgi:hypothetical protein